MVNLGTRFSNIEEHKRMRVLNGAITKAGRDYESKTRCPLPGH